MALNVMIHAILNTCAAALLSGPTKYLNLQSDTLLWKATVFEKFSDSPE
jgi:hypothetical protein